MLLPLMIFLGCPDVAENLPTFDTEDCVDGTIVGTTGESQCLSWLWGQPNAHQTATALAQYCNASDSGQSFYIEEQRKAFTFGVKLTWMTTYVLRIQN